MAKIVKRKKRRLAFVTKAFIFLSFSLLCMLISSLYIGTRNASLAIKVQKINNEIAVYKQENQNLTIQIQTLQNKERVYLIAKESGLNQNQDNIISINNGD